MRSFSKKTNREKHDSRIMALTWGIVAIIVAISSVWWWQNQQKNEIDIAEEEQSALVSPVPTDASTEVSIESVAIAENELTAEEKAQPQIDQLEPLAVTTDTQTIQTGENTATVASEENTAENSAKANQAEEKATAATIVSTNQLEMSFNDDCWIQVKDATGKTLETGIKKAGQTLSVDGKTPYKIILGAPENVSITLASEPVDLSGYTSGKVARFTLP